MSNGRVVGTWKRTLKRSTAAITIDAFDPLPQPVLRYLDAAAERYAKFHDRTAEVTQLAG